MKVNNLYKEINHNGILKIKNKKEKIDDYLNHMEDRRMGLALLIRPSEQIQRKIAEIVRVIQKIEPDQYFYKNYQHHITLLDFTTARQDFKYSKEQIKIYTAITEDVLKNIKKFKIHCKGLIASNDAILVKGFYENIMNQIRKELRNKMKENNLKNDERYKTMSSHITIARFKEPLKNRDKLLETLKMYEQYDFGEFYVSNIEFVYHNWYDSKRELIRDYYLSD